MYSPWSGERSASQKQMKFLSEKCPSLSTEELPPPAGYRDYEDYKDITAPPTGLAGSVLNKVSEFSQPTWADDRPPRL